MVVPPRPLQDPAIGAVVDASSYARRVLGPGNRQRLQLEVLLALANVGEKPVKHLAQQLVLKPATVSRLLGRLETGMLVQCRTDSVRRKERYYSATQRGIDLAIAVRDARKMEAALQEGLRELSLLPQRARPEARTFIAAARVPLPTDWSRRLGARTRLALWRRARGLRQEELAERAGISLRALQRLEAGHQDWEKLTRCATELGVRRIDLDPRSQQ